MAVFLPIVPNWKSGVRDTYEFKTDVFTTRNGNEQRRSLRKQPRRTINAAILLDGERLRLFSDALNLAKDGKVEVADFSADAAITTTTVSDGASILTVDRVPAWMGDSMTAVLLTGRTTRKVSIDFIEDNQVVLSTALVGAVGAGAQLLPLMPASLETTNTLSTVTTSVATSSIAFNVEPGTIVREADPLPFTDEPDAETTQVFGPAAIFFGRYVLLRKPNYLQAPEMAFNIDFEKVDYGRGVVKTFTPVPMISRTLTATYMAVSHAEAMALLDIFIRTRGRAGEIYVPTWGKDFPPIVSIGSYTITVEGTDFADAYATDTAHRTFLARMADGSLLPLEIAGISKSDGNSVILCTTDPGVTPDQIVQISWMFVSRFAQDALTIEWFTNGVANVALSFVTLANLAASESYGNNWILATGYWRDSGIWQDSSLWQD